MTTITMQPAVTPLNYVVGEALLLEIARATGLQTSGSASQLLYGRGSVFTRTAAVVDVLMRHGQAPRAQHLCRPITTRLADLPPVPLNTMLLVQKAVADGDEEGPRAAFQGNRCRATAVALARALDEEDTLNRELRRALFEDYGV